MKELKYFIKSVKSKKKVKKDYDIKNAISSLKIALKLKNQTLFSLKLFVG